MRDHGLVSSNKAQHAPRTRRREEDEHQQDRERTKAKFAQMMHMSGPGSLDACGCGAELIFVSQDKFTCCQWAASMQELQFLCYPHNSLLLGCRSGPRRGELERREGEEDEPPLDFLSEEEEEREFPVVGQCEWEIMPPPPPSPRSSLLPNSQSSTSSGFFLKIFLCTSSRRQ